MGILPKFEIETVKKVHIGEKIHSKMSAKEIQSSLSYFFYTKSTLNTINSEEIKNSISVDYVLSDNGKVDTIELITTMKTSAARKVLLKTHKELDEYVSNQMLQKFEQPKTIKQITLAKKVVKNLSNDEIQSLLGAYFESSDLIRDLDPEGFEFKFIVDHEGNIWQFELISTLPKEQAEKQISPLFVALSEFSKSKLLSIAYSKEAG